MKLGEHTLDLCVCLLVSVPNYLSADGRGTDHPLSLWVPVVGSQCDGQKPILVDSQGVLATADHPELGATLPLLLFAGLPALFFGSVNVGQHSRKGFLKLLQHRDITSQSEVGVAGTYSIRRFVRHQPTMLPAVPTSVPRQRLNLKTRGASVPLHDAEALTCILRLVAGSACLHCSAYSQVDARSGRRTQPGFQATMRPG